MNESTNQPINLLVVHTDGGSRGNPGPAAAGVAFYQDGQLIHSLSQYLGHTTNNQAEYQAVLLAANYLVEKPTAYAGFDQIQFTLDSELIVRQLNGLYKVKHADLLPLYQKLLSLLHQITLPITFVHVKRHLNKHADLLVNEELDRQK